MERRQQVGRAEDRRLQYVISILSTLPQHRRAGMTRVGRAMVRELGMKGAVTVDAEDAGSPADARRRAQSQLVLRHSASLT